MKLRPAPRDHAVMRTRPCALALAALVLALPARADQRATARHGELDRMLKALLAAPDERTAALLEGHIDIAVHSLKDLGTQRPAGLVTAAIPPRAHGEKERVPWFDAT